MKIIGFIIIIIILYWFLILKPRRLNFWKIVHKFPDDAYDLFISNRCWKVFQDALPLDYLSIVPEKDWIGPYRLQVPKLGNKLIYVFGKYPDCEPSQKEFVTKLMRNLS